MDNKETYKNFTNFDELEMQIDKLKKEVENNLTIILENQKGEEEKVRIELENVRKELKEKRIELKKKKQLIKAFESSQEPSHNKSKSTISFIVNLIKTMILIEMRKKPSWDRKRMSKGTRKQI